MPIFLGGQTSGNATPLYRTLFRGAPPLKKEGNAILGTNAADNARLAFFIKSRRLIYFLFFYRLVNLKDCPNADFVLDSD